VILYIVLYGLATSKSNTINDSILRSSYTTAIPHLTIYRPHNRIFRKYLQSIITEQQALDCTAERQLIPMLLEFHAKVKAQKDWTGSNIVGTRDGLEAVVYFYFC
jgi:hypothetical protein